MGPAGKGRDLPGARRAGPVLVCLRGAWAGVAGCKGVWKATCSGARGASREHARAIAPTPGYRGLRPKLVLLFLLGTVSSEESRQS